MQTNASYITTSFKDTLAGGQQRNGANHSVRARGGFQFRARIPHPG
jgi:hypothetical protein